jgi:hypothetical protein
MAILSIEAMIAESVPNRHTEVDFRDIFNVEEKKKSLQSVNLGGLRKALSLSNSSYRSQFNKPTITENYRRRQVKAPPPIEPTNFDVRYDCVGATNEFNYFFLLRQYALFETFLQCWVFNFLVAHVEADLPLLPAQLKILQTMNAGDYQRAPGVQEIKGAFKKLFGEIAQMPHADSDRKGLPLLEPYGSLTINSVQELAKDMRDSIAHFDQRLEAERLSKHKVTLTELSDFHDLKLKFGDSQDKIASNFQLTRVLFYPLRRCAERLDYELHKISGGTRGSISDPRNMPANSLGLSRPTFPFTL